MRRLRLASASSGKWTRKGRISFEAAERTVSGWVVAVVILVSFLVVSLPMAAAVIGENAARAAIATPMRSRARRDRTEAAVDLSVVIVSFLSVVVLGIRARNA